MLKKVNQPNLTYSIDKRKGNDDDSQNNTSAHLGSLRYNCGPATSSVVPFAALAYQLSSRFLLCLLHRHFLRR